MRAILQHTSYSVEAIGPWLENNELAGVSVTLILSEPLTIEADWPHVERDGQSWRSLITHYRVHDLKKLDWQVDPSGGRIAGIDAIIYSLIEPR